MTDEPDDIVLQYLRRIDAKLDGLAGGAPARREAQLDAPSGTPERREEAHGGEMTLRTGDRIEHPTMPAPQGHGTVDHIDAHHVRVKWNDGRIGVLFWVTR